MKLRAFCAVLLGLAAIAPAQYVRVSPRDHRYLELSDGSPYIPIGPNLIAPPRANAGEDEALGGLEEWLSKLATNHGNYIRVWLSSPFWEVEHRRSGEYDGDKAKRIDRLLVLCRKYGIRVKFTMEHFRSIGGGSQSWADKPMHNTANGGPAQSIADFFEGAPSREQFRGKIRWYAERFGDQEMVYGWELWNEINAIRGGNYMDWTAAMLPELHRAFPKNIAMQSLGSFDTARVVETYRRHSTMAGNDLAQVHRYLDLGASLDVCKGPVDVLAADAVRTLLAYGPKRPVVLAESGAVEPRHSGPFKLYKADREGTLLHDVLFAPFLAGAAGGGQIWHWDSYVAANDLWWQYGRFAEAIKNIDPREENFEPLMLDHDRLRVYALKGRRNTLIWARDSRNSWVNELQNGEKPERLRGMKVDLRRSLTGRGAKSASVYDPWVGKWSKAGMKGDQITLPEFSRSIVVRVP